jgi:hypothetical protein
MIGRHLAYGRYLLRHKWFVLLACRRTGAGLWRGLVHDLSKFLPSEWFAYAATFYAADGTSRYAPDEQFDAAWLHHQRRNRHHWQYWVLLQDGGREKPLPMPERFVREMVADWMGAGLAQSKKDTRAWYLANRQNMRLHPLTEARAEQILFDKLDFAKS